MHQTTRQTGTANPGRLGALEFSMRHSLRSNKHLRGWLHLERVRCLGEPLFCCTLQDTLVVFIELGCAAETHVLSEEGPPAGRPFLCYINQGRSTTQFSQFIGMFIACNFL